MKSNSLKRPFDIALSLVGIIISIPLWILVGILILIEDGWPVFYSHERVGRKGKIFKVLKFRSMIKDAEEGIGPIQAKENDLRITKAGRLLRTMAIDELPQLVNILKGDMSFVGPRALRLEEIEVKNQKLDSRNWNIENKNQELEVKGCEKENGKLETSDRNAKLETGICEPGEGDCNEGDSLEKIPGYHDRQSVRPGLTGIAQIYLPTDALRQMKFRYDFFYIEKQNFWLDLKLIFLSFWVSFRGKWESREKKL